MSTESILAGAAGGVIGAAIASSLSGPTSGIIDFALQYEISPIMLVNGIAGQNQSMPLIYITDGQGAGDTLTSISDINQFFAKYVPLPGSTLVQNEIAQYPFANQQVAANAIIAQPLTISMMMICPATPQIPYSQKQSILTSLTQSLQQHNALGGLYNINTPAYLYTFCIMTGMRDVSSSDTNQVQLRYQLDFQQPLVTLAAAQQAQTNLMQTITNGGTINGTPSWSTNAAPPLNLGSSDLALA